MKPSEIRAVRKEGLPKPPCEPTEHYWAEVVDGTFVLFVLCRKCGRTPLEMLSELKLDPAVTEGHDATETT